MSEFMACLKGPKASAGESAPTRDEYEELKRRVAQEHLRLASKNGKHIE